MLDDVTTGGSMPAPRCNWCSAVLPSDHETVCPSCGATLIGDGDAAVPGLTAIDAEAILRSARAQKTKSRSRLLGWISGDVDDDGGTVMATPGSLAPPPADVRREILRLELEAQVANAQAEVESMAADDAVEHGTSLAAPVAERDAEPESEAAAEAESEAEPEAESEAAAEAESQAGDASDYSAADATTSESPPV
jgi:hypothetical protein